MRTKNGDHTVTSSGSNVVSSGIRWPCPGPSTIVPSLGIPFRDAAARLVALVKEQDELPDTPEADARSDEITEQWEVLGRAILSAIPRTPADSVAVIDTALCPAVGPNMDRATKELFQRVRGVLVQAALDTAQRDDAADRSPFLADVRRWLELEATIGAEGQDDADLIDSSEEAFRLARQIAAYDGNPTLAMAAKAVLLWAEHPVACHPDSRPGALPFPPPVSAARKEEDALIFGLVADALRAVPELTDLLTSEASVANESDDFGAAIASLADRAIPRTAPAAPTVITDAMVEAGANAAGCSPDAFRAGMTAALKMMEAA